MKLQTNLSLLGILLFASGLISYILAQYLGMQGGMIDIQIHDTYLVISPLHFAVLLFIPTTYFTYLIKEWPYRYQRNPQRSILFLMGIVLLLLLVLVFYSIYHYQLRFFLSVPGFLFTLTIVTLVLLVVNPWKK